MSFYTWTDDTKAEFERAVQSPTAAQRGSGTQQSQVLCKPTDSGRSQANPCLQGFHNIPPAR